MILILVFSVVLGASNAFADGGGRRIILFGAEWCAPCLVELRNVAKVAAAAAPDRLLVAWIDGDVRRLAEGKAPNIDVVRVDDARRMLAAMTGDLVGLPYAVMTDAAGRRCAEWRAPLRPEDVAELKASCD